MYLKLYVSFLLAQSKGGEGVYHKAVQIQLDRTVLQVILYL